MAVDGIFHVVRAFEKKKVEHVEGNVNLVLINVRMYFTFWNLIGQLSSFRYATKLFVGQEYSRVSIRKELELGDTKQSHKPLREVARSNCLSPF